MGSRGRSGSRRILLLLTLLAVLVALGAGLASPAGATPVEPTMSLARLQELLAASPTGTVDGYFKTVVKGSAIVSIPCTLQGIVPQAAYDNGDLILFEATGAVITEIGGIAAGMSGSPVYVNDGGVDKVVAAVSYGDIFNKEALGLATPIEHMMAIESDFTIDPIGATAARAVALDEPLNVAGRQLSTVVVAPTSAAARAYGKTGRHTALMRSLSVLQVGGIAPGSPVFAQMRDRLAARGVELRAGLEGGAAGALPTFTTPLVPGASVGDVLIRGDYWVGGVGTVTYVTADGGLVAFGHPMEWDGVVSSYLTNADVIGTWSSTMEPYKVVAPGAVRGTVTVDTGAGIAGQIDAIPDDVPFTCTATNTATGKTVTTSSYATPWAADQSKYPYWDLKAMAFYPALYLATGDSAYDGHVTYTMTIGMSDGVHDYTVTRHNTWEDSYGYDAPFLVVTELASMLTTLTNDPDGTIHPHITGIDLDVDISPTLHRARIVDVSVEGGVRTGLNTVKVKMYEYGSLDPVVVDVPLTIPEGMSTKGTVYAKAPFTNVESEGDGWYGWWSMYGPDTGPPQTLADVVAGLNAATDNDTLLVAYDPPSSGSGYDDWYDWGEPWSAEAVVASVDRNEYLTGEVMKEQANIYLWTPWSILSGQPVEVSGDIQADWSLEGQQVEIYARQFGETSDTLVAQLPIVGHVDQDESSAENSFAGVVPPLKYNAVLTAVWEGNDQYLYSWNSVNLLVRAKVTCAAKADGGKVHLAATVAPKQTAGKVWFMRKQGKRWVNIKILRLSDSKATYTWDPRAGTYKVRAVFSGTGRNAPNVSKTVSVTVS